MNGLHVFFPNQQKTLGVIPALGTISVKFGVGNRMRYIGVLSVPRGLLGSNFWLTSAGRVGKGKTRKIKNGNSVFFCQRCALSTSFDILTKPKAKRPITLFFNSEAC